MILASYVQKLPDRPGEFRQRYPHLYARAYGNSPETGPVPCKLKAAELRSIEATYNCRNNGITSLALAPAQRAPANQNEPMDQFCMMNTFMQFMQNQSHMMERMRGGSGDAGIEINYLERDSSRGGFRKMPTVDLSPRSSISGPVDTGVGPGGPLANPRQIDNGASRFQMALGSTAAC